MGNDNVWLSLSPFWFTWYTQTHIHMQARIHWTVTESFMEQTAGRSQCCCRLSFLSHETTLSIDQHPLLPHLWDSAAKICIVETWNLCSRCEIQVLFSKFASQNITLLYQQVILRNVTNHAWCANGCYILRNKLLVIFSNERQIISTQKYIFFFKGTNIPKLSKADWELRKLRNVPTGG